MTLSKRQGVSGLGVVIAALLATTTGAAPVGQQPNDTRAHVEALAADALGGRLTGSEGARQAADYIASQLRAIGAVPLPGREDFRLPFEYVSGARDTGSTLRAGGAVELLAATGGVQALAFSDSGAVSGPVVFAGYGITVPENRGFPYDNFATLDVAGKIVLVLRYIPEDVDQETRALLGEFSDLRYKATRARDLGALGLLVVTGPRSANAGELIAMGFDSSAAGSGIVAASISGEVADALFAAVPEMTLAQAQQGFDEGDPHVAGFDLPGIEVSLDVKLERERSTGYNVVGYLPPSDPGAAGVAKPYVALGAHYDHLGAGAGGGSLARGDEVGEVHNGADDNASGVAAVLAAGAQLAELARDRGIVLAFWSGEELGLLGSQAFVQSSVIAPDELAAYLNFDMVGRVRDNVLTIQAVGSSAAWPRLIERTNVPIGFDVRTQDDPYLPTDSTAFNTAGVPTLSFFSGTHEQYHRPGDDADLINYDDLERVARFGALLARRVATTDEAPAFVAVPRTLGQMGGSRDTVRVWTGTIPDMATEVAGLALSGVMEGGPAQDAGLRAGDIIVEFAGLEIANIYDYQLALESVKIDVPVKVVYERDGERFEVELTPRARR